MTRHGTSRDQTGTNLRKNFPEHRTLRVERMDGLHKATTVCALSV